MIDRDAAMPQFNNGAVPQFNNAAIPQFNLFSEMKVAEIIENVSVREYQGASQHRESQDIGKIGVEIGR